jgi:ArsR family transcriptional regulator, virulence genes transcriptional regulator
MMHLLDARNESAERAASFLKTVAHPGRLRIVCALLEGECTATGLAAHARLTAPALSQQAAVLESAGIIAHRRAGRSVLYRLLAPEAKALAQLLYRMFCKPSANVTRRAKRYSASPSKRGNH